MAGDALLWSDEACGRICCDSCAPSCPRQVHTELYRAQSVLAAQDRRFEVVVPSERLCASREDARLDSWSRHAEQIDNPFTWY